jgi:hypothetical protein
MVQISPPESQLTRGEIWAEFALLSFLPRYFSDSQLRRKLFSKTLHIFAATHQEKLAVFQQQHT